MRVSLRHTTQRETLTIRINPEVRKLIDRAAQITGRTSTDFVVDAARRAAEDTLRDESCREFPALFEPPPRPNKRLLKTMQTPVPWE